MRMTNERLDALKRKFHLDELSTGDMKELIAELVATRNLLNMYREKRRYDGLNGRMWHMCHHYEADKAIAAAEGEPWKE